MHLLIHSNPVHSVFITSYMFPLTFSLPLAAGERSTGEPRAGVSSGAVAGGVMGGILCLLVAVLVVVAISWLLIKKHKRAKDMASSRFV